MYVCFLSLPFLVLQKLQLFACVVIACAHTHMPLDLGNELYRKVCIVETFNKRGVCQFLLARCDRYIFLKPCLQCSGLLCMRVLEL